MRKIIEANRRRELSINESAREIADESQALKVPQAWENREATAQAHRASQARVASNRRRSVDPCTSDLEYSAAELEFMLAMQEYKQSSGRMFPTWSEVLEVITKLGYEKPRGATDPESGS